MEENRFESVRSTQKKTVGVEAEPPVPPLQSQVEQPLTSSSKKEGRGCLWVAIAILAFFVIGFVAVLFILVIAIAGSGSSSSKVESHVIEDGTWGEEIAVIPLNGVITSESSQASLFSSGGTTDKKFYDMVEQALEDDDVKAVIVKVNSPGGEVVASDNMYRELLKLSAQKPVIVYVESMSASGSYYVSMGGEYIIAHPASMIGSIGVIAQVNDLKGLYEKLGIKSKVFTTGEFKDSSAYFDKETASEGEEMMDDILDASLDLFVGVIVKGRKMQEQEVRELADGKVYSAQRAKELGLVDEVGFFDDAIDYAKKKGKAPSARVVEYKSKKSFWESLDEKFPFSALSSTVNNPTQKQLMYIWGE